MQNHIKRPMRIYDTKEYKVIRLIGTIVWLAVMGLCIYAGCQIAETKADVVGVTFVFGAALIWITYLNTPPKKKDRTNKKDVDYRWRTLIKQEGMEYLIGLFALGLIIGVVELVFRLK